MTDSPNDPDAKRKFLYPKKTYRGKPEMENIVFDANLQEFAQRVGYICSLENGGKMSPSEAYEQIKELYKTLRESKRNLGIGRDDDPDSKGSRKRPGNAKDSGGEAADGE